MITRDQFTMKLICLLTIVPMLVCAEQAPGDNSNAGASGKDDAAVAERAESAERLSDYRRAGDWRRFAELFEATIKKVPPKYGEHVFAETVGVGMGGDSWALNTTAWDVFTHCDNKVVLEQALNWSELSIRVAQPLTHPETEPYPIQSLDTKANLLYKLGRVDEAIAAEQAAVARVMFDWKKAGKVPGGHYLDDLNTTVDKMRKGEPTWPAK